MQEIGHKSFTKETRAWRSSSPVSQSGYCTSDVSAHWPKICSIS